MSNSSLNISNSSLNTSNNSLNALNNSFNIPNSSLNTSNYSLNTLNNSLNSSNNLSETNGLPYIPAITSAAVVLLQFFSVVTLALDEAFSCISTL